MKDRIVRHLSFPDTDRHVLKKAWPHTTPHAPCHPIPSSITRNIINIKTISYGSIIHVNITVKRNMNENRSMCIVHAFDHREEISARYCNAFCLSAPSICPPKIRTDTSRPSELQPRGKRQKVDKDKSGIPPQAIGVPWDKITELVAADIRDIGAKYQADEYSKETCSQTFFACKEKLKSYRFLARSMRVFSDISAVKDTVASIQDVDADPTVLFTRLVENEAETIWESPMGRILVPSCCTFHMGEDICLSLSDMCALPSCVSRYKVSKLNRLVLSLS